jgi:hypothetical protein
MTPAAEDDLIDSPLAPNPARSQGWLRARASVNIFACTISGGIVAVPKAFADASLLLATGLCVAAGFTTALSLYVLAMVSQRTNSSRSYGQVTTHVCGAFAGQVSSRTTLGRPTREEPESLFESGCELHNRPLSLGCIGGIFHRFGRYLHSVGGLRCNCPTRF